MERCTECASVRDYLREKKSREITYETQTKFRTATTSKTNTKHLTQSELQIKLKNVTKERDQLMKLVNQHNSNHQKVEVDDDIDNIIRTAIQERKDILGEDNSYQSYS